MNHLHRITYFSYSAPPPLFQPALLSLSTFLHPLTPLSLPPLLPLPCTPFHPTPLHYPCSPSPHPPLYNPCSPSLILCSPIFYHPCSPSSGSLTILLPLPSPFLYHLCSSLHSPNAHLYLCFPFLPTPLYHPYSPFPTLPLYQSCSPSPPAHPPLLLLSIDPSPRLFLPLSTTPAHLPLYHLCSPSPHPLSVSRYTTLFLPFPPSSPGC